MCWASSVCLLCSSWRLGWVRSRVTATSWSLRCHRARCACLPAALASPLLMQTHLTCLYRCRADVFKAMLVSGSLPLLVSACTSPSFMLDWSVVLRRRSLTTTSSSSMTRSSSCQICRRSTSARRWSWKRSCGSRQLLHNRTSCSRWLQ